MTIQRTAAMTTSKISSDGPVVSGHTISVHAVRLACISIATKRLPVRA
jgi:hypothetical protein